MDANSRLTPMTLCPGATVYMPPEALTIPPHYSNKLDCFSHAVLTIQICSRTFPKPGIAHQSKEDSNYPTGCVLIQVPEMERRKEDIDKVEPDHPLLPIALQCLHNQAAESLSADELCVLLATLKEGERYATSVQQAKDQTSLIQTLRREIAQKDRTLHQERAQHEMELVQKIEVINSQQIEIEKKEENWLMEKTEYEKELQQKDMLIGKERADHEVQLQEKGKIIQELQHKHEKQRASESASAANSKSSQEDTASTPESPDFTYPSSEDFQDNVEHDYEHDPILPPKQNASNDLMESFGMEKSLAEIDKILAELGANTSGDVGGIIYDDLVMEHQESHQEKEKASREAISESEASKAAVSETANPKDVSDATSAKIFDEPIYDVPRAAIFPLYVTENNIAETKVLKVGYFSDVVQANTVGLSKKDLKLSRTDTDRGSSTVVVIKRLKENAGSNPMGSFYAEAELMAKLDHDNVIRLLAVCKSDRRPFMMTEYMENGSLVMFLQRLVLKPDTLDHLQDGKVTPTILLYMGVQIANGMHYLSSKHIIHGELSARSCLVGTDFIIKISHFEMSKSLHKNLYYHVQGTHVLPIRWMSCETFYGKFSVKSDAWAFGVTLWEIYTLGKVDPYNYLSDEELLQDAIKGPDRKILEKPSDCPHNVYDVMLRCWVHQPAMRANFLEIYSHLFLIYKAKVL